MIDTIISIYGKDPNHEINHPQIRKLYNLGSIAAYLFTEVLIMTTVDEIRGIFSILHDGKISAWTGDKKSLTLTVNCQHLAEQIDKSFNKFLVEITDIDELFLLTWQNPFDLPIQRLTELTDIFRAELQILSAEIKDGKVVVACSQHDTDFDYCGGNLITKKQSNLTI